MYPIIIINKPLPGIDLIGIYARKTTDKNEIHYPVVVDRSNFQIRINEGGTWYADGLSKEICSYVGNLIDQHKL